RWVAAVAAACPVYFPAATFRAASGPFAPDKTSRPGCCPGQESLCGFDRSTEHVETECRECWGFHSAPPDAHSQTYNPHSGDQQRCGLRGRCSRRKVSFPFPLPDGGCRRIRDRRQDLETSCANFEGKATDPQNFQPGPLSANPRACDALVARASSRLSDGLVPPTSGVRHRGCCSREKMTDARPVPDH